MDVGILQEYSHWPKEKPGYDFDDHGWFGQNNADVIGQFLTDETRVILELGSWLGKSARWMLDNSNADIICVDTWTGGSDLKNEYRIDGLKERFQASCWEYRDRIIMLEMESVIGVSLVSSCGVVPDLIYLDASHEYLDVLSDLRAIKKHFPNVHLVGDDITKQFPGVERAINDMGLNIERLGGVWWEVKE
jgi:hypothetical protein